ncbi:hypothetical protein Tco_0064102 [Tanacetum coccineum]
MEILNPSHSSLSKLQSAEDGILDTGGQRKGKEKRKEAMTSGLQVKFKQQKTSMSLQDFLDRTRRLLSRNSPEISSAENQIDHLSGNMSQTRTYAELKSKSFEEIQVLYERYKKQDQTLWAIGSEEDERAIKKMNEKDDDKEEE